MDWWYQPVGSSFWNPSWWLRDEDFDVPQLGYEERQPRSMEVGRQRQPSALRFWTNAQAGQVRTERKSTGELVIKAQLPGVARDDVKLELRDDETMDQSVLVLSASKKEEHHQNDRRGGFFQRNSEFHIMRTIPLGAKVTADEIKADLADDQLVIEVVLPQQTATQKPASRIDITSASRKNIGAQKTQPKAGKGEAMDTDISTNQ